MVRTRSAIITVGLLIFMGFPAIPEAKSVTLGGKFGWPALSYSSGLTRGKGQLGQQALVLSTALPDQKTLSPSKLLSGDEQTDLYLSFDSSPMDVLGHYATISSTLLIANSGKAERGTGAALCNTDGKGLTLRGHQGALFSSPGDSGSFSIEFWLYPAVTENGSVLFQWRSSRIGAGVSMYQYVRSSIFHNHVEWTFSNLFTNSSGSPLDVTVSGRKNLIPGVWTHHELSWDATTGLLEYCLDGSTEDLKYITSTGTERGDVYPAVIGTPADVEIASRFSGIIDEFKIRKTAVSFDDLETRHTVLERYPAVGGRFESMPIDSGALNSALNSITVVQSAPGETDTAFFVRAGDNFYLWTENEPAWIPVKSGEKLTGITGQFFQVAGELYTDGRGAQTPSVTSVTLSYEEDSPPWPPVRVMTASKDGSVTLSWPASIDFDTAGYLVYYGDHPGEYLGEGSPLDVGNVRTFTVTGLKNGRLYYFCVAAYDASGVRYPGALSGEVHARPQASRNSSGM